MTLGFCFYKKNFTCIFKGHILSREQTRSQGRQKKTYGMMDVEQFKVTLAELLGIPAWEAKSLSALSEQAELLFRKVYPML